MMCLLCILVSAMKQHNAKLTITLTLVVMVQNNFYLANGENCTEGKYMYSYSPGVSAETVCIECPQGTFMPQINHTHSNCFNCTDIGDPQLEVLINPCNKTRDSNIQCVEGYYRRLPRNPRENGRCLECQPCVEKFYEIRSCQNFSDIRCCADVNYDFEYNKYGVAVCRERPWMCRQGQYFDTSIFNCRQCPPNTFMPVDYHSLTECFKCQNTSDPHMPLNSIILQPCNSTHPAVIGCNEGFYINHTMGFRKTNIGCSPCQKCDRKYVGRQCNMSHDTVCCDEPNMTVMEDGTCRNIRNGVVTYTKTSPQHAMQNDGIDTHGQTDKSTHELSGKNSPSKKTDCDEKWLYAAVFFAGMFSSVVVYFVFVLCKARKWTSCIMSKNTTRNPGPAENAELDLENTRLQTGGDTCI